MSVFKSGRELCVGVSGGVRLWVRESVNASVRERVSGCKCLRVFVEEREREQERECVCVCARERERESGEGEKENGCRKIGKCESSTLVIENDLALKWFGM